MQHETQNLNYLGSDENCVVIVHAHPCVCVQVWERGGKNGNIFVISLLCHKDSIADGSESWGFAPLHAEHTHAQNKQLHLNYTEEALLFQAIQALFIFRPQSPELVTWPLVVSHTLDFTQQSQKSLRSWLWLKHQWPATLNVFMPSSLTSCLKVEESLKSTWRNCLGH